MEEKQTLKQMRRELAPITRALLLYYLLMNLVVMMVLSIDVAIQVLTAPAGIDLAQVTTEASQTNYWGYLVTIGIGLAILLAWKGRRFWQEEIWKPGKAMTVSVFFLLLVWMFNTQILLQLLDPILNWLLGFLGLSTKQAMEAASANVETLSMFLYVCIAAPIAEELLFRGLILRGLMPYGKKFAVFASAILFGLFHGNLVQTPFAFMVGLILGFTAAEYNIGWAMVLHMFNNLILGDTLMRLFSLLTPLASLIVDNVFVVATVVAVIVLTWRKRRSIRAWFKSETINGRAFAALLLNPSAIALLVISLLTMAISIL